MYRRTVNDLPSGRLWIASTIRRFLGAALTLVLVSLLAGPAAAAAAALPPAQASYYDRANTGVQMAKADSAWGNAKWHWYNRLLTGNTKNPLATIWDVVGLWEAQNDLALAKPTKDNVRQVDPFGRFAEKYWDKNITPVEPAPAGTPKTPAYGPYPGAYNDPETFCDDNAWWSLAFLDAHDVFINALALAEPGSRYEAWLKRRAARYLFDAERGFEFIEDYCWDGHDGGGMWWSTAHRVRSGEVLGLAIELAARLYKETGDAPFPNDSDSNESYLRDALKWIYWANYHLLKWDGSYANDMNGPSAAADVARRGADAAPCSPTSPRTSPPCEVIMPHDGEGAMIGGFTALCVARVAVPPDLYNTLPANKPQGVNPSYEQPSDPTSWCSWAEALASHTALGVNPGGGVQDAIFPPHGAPPNWAAPQWDAPYIRGLLTLYSYDHNRRWYALATRTAHLIITRAKDSDGLFLKGWDGSTSIRDAVPGMLRTHAWSVSVFGALANVPPPS